MDGALAGGAAQLPTLGVLIRRSNSAWALAFAASSPMFKSTLSSDMRCMRSMLWAILNAVSLRVVWLERKRSRCSTLGSTGPIGVEVPLPPLGVQVEEEVEAREGLRLLLLRSTSCFTLRSVSRDTMALSVALRAIWFSLSPIGPHALLKYVFCSACSCTTLIHKVI